MHLGAKDPAMLIIFDCDGVLVDSEMIASRVLAAELSRLGYPLTAADARVRFTGKRMRDVISTVEEAGVPVPEGFLEHLKTRDLEAFRSGLQAIPGIREILKTLPHRRCVASSGSFEKMNFTLDHTGLLPFLKPRLFSASQVSHGKPAPDLFLFAAQEMEESPSACVVVEDSIAGVEAGKAAGMRVLGFTGGAHVKDDPHHERRLRAAGADAVFTKMQDLSTLL